MTAAHTLALRHTPWNAPAPRARVPVVQLLPHDARTAPLMLRLVAPRHHDPAPPGPTGPTEELWEHEVVECFIAGADGTYLEVELGPHGHHLVLRLAGPRDPVERLLPWQPSVAVGPGLWAAAALLPARWLPPRPWRVLATAVHGPADARIHQTSTPLPGPTPDFHQPDHFAPFEPVAEPGPDEALLAAAGAVGHPDRARIVTLLATLRAR